VIASNIANADTPGYQARDLDFASRRCARPPAAPARRWELGTTAPGRDARAAGASGRRSPALRYAPPSQTNLDSNTVDMDRERASFADNASSTRPRCASSTAACAPCSTP
jgi:flagellar basal-body rod protein FlgB